MASSSGSLTSSYNHNVFLSFRGEETRTGFTYNLYKALERESIKAFFDDHKLKRGEDISAALQKAIEVSNFSVVIRSENYSSSSWCLDELVKILECQKSTGQIVIPVFYKVNPTDVRYQTGRFGQGFADLRHKSLDYRDKNPKWKEALTQVSNLSGWVYTEGYESDFIEKVVKEIKFRKISKGVDVSLDQPSSEVGNNLGSVEHEHSAFLENQNKMYAAAVSNQADLNFLKTINGVDFYSHIYLDYLNKRNNLKWK